MPSPCLQVVFNLPLNSTFTYGVPEGIEPQIGVRVEAPFGHRKMTGYVVGLSDRPMSSDFVVKNILKTLDSEPLFGTGTLELARWLSSMYMCSLGESLAAIIPSGKREMPHATLDVGEAEIGDKPLTLSEEQVLARERILQQPHGMTYLYGITGSGKTEVFMQVAEATMAGGKSVIYLVPEIALTGQVIEAVAKRFGAGCAVLHSGLTPSRRLSEWRRILRGEVRIVIGARSAVFAPLPDLGLIILDEEHESSYKSGSSPRYHARQVAMRRASIEGARLVMGSATPSVEAWHSASSGGLESVRLATRPAGGANPVVHVVDMSKESGAVSQPLYQAVLATKAAGGQSILFLNRRGFSWFFRCATCGADIKCKHCAVSLTYHKDRDSLECHYCGFRMRKPQSCPGCSSLDVGLVGFGTERIEEDLHSIFPGLSVRRLDADSAAKKGAAESILADFRSGRIDILLGTQMVAKGLDFPSVRTVGILLADSSLGLPDFRAAERTFALVVQVAGRAGRHRPDGEVYLQTWRPQDPVIRMAASLDTEAFYSWELGQRKMLGFPPFSRLLRVVLRSRTKAAGADAASRLAGHLVKYLEPCDEVLGPAPCPVERIADTDRIQLIMKGQSAPRLRRALSAALEARPLPSSVRIEIDVDPVNLM